MYDELIKVHRECKEFIINNDFNGFNKFVKKHLKENRETIKINKLRLILLASKDSQDIRVHQILQKVMDEHAKIVRTFEPVIPKVKTTVKVK
jgi:hypothetical protein